MLALQASRKKYANQFALKRWLRPGIVIWPTTVSADPGGMGAFAPAGGLGRGKFIGMYCADKVKWEKLAVHPFVWPTLDCLLAIMHPLRPLWLKVR